jgi:hypothetical protein
LAAPASQNVLAIPRHGDYVGSNRRREWIYTASYNQQATQSEFFSSFLNLGEMPSVLDSGILANLQSAQT